MKRKTDGSYHVSGGKHGKGYVNRISSGRPAFTLNDSRRVGAQTGNPSIQTRMKGTGYRGHGGNCGTFVINPIRSNYSNDYDPHDKHSFSRPKPVPACPVVQQMTPMDAETYGHILNAKIVSKDICDKPPDKSGSRTNCAKPSNANYGTFVHKTSIDYEQYLKRKHLPLPRGKEHYPPMVSRNSSFASLPNFSLFDFIQRLSCK